MVIMVSQSVGRLCGFSNLVIVFGLRRLAARDPEAHDPEARAHLLADHQPNPAPPCRISKPDDPDLYIML